MMTLLSNITITVIIIMIALYTGVGKEGVAAPPTLFEKGGHSPSTFLVSNGNFLSSAMPLHTSECRTNGKI